MKKLTVLMIILFATCAVAMAQPRAVGGRLGFGIGASYQHNVGDNMIQVDLDIAGFHAIQGTATYNWVFPISSWNKEGSWNWYAGVGAGIGYSWWGDWIGLNAHARKAWKGYGGYGSYAGWGFGAGPGAGCGFVGVAGLIGVEYNCKFPMQVFVDYRPVIGPCFYSNKFAADGKYYKKVDFYYDGLIASALTVGLRYNF